MWQGFCKILLLLENALSSCHCSSVRTCKVSTHKNRDSRTLKSRSFFEHGTFHNLVEGMLTVPSGWMEGNRCKKWKQKLNGGHWLTAVGRTLKVGKDVKDGILSPSALQISHLIWFQISRFVASLSEDKIVAHVDAPTHSTCWMVRIACACV